jgi:hypothetical protein
MRHAISTVSFGLSPATTRLTRKMASEPMNVARSPKLRISHACISIAIVMAARVPVMSHCARSCPMPNAPMMSGIATLIDVVVTTAAELPSSTVVATSAR